MVIQKIKRFGDKEIKLLFALEQQENQIFNIVQAKKMLGTSDASVKNVLKRLKKKHRVIPLQRGTYLFAPFKSGEEGLWTEDAFRVAPSLVAGRQYYIGFLSAMNYWGMTEQIPIVVYVVLTLQKRNLEAVQAKYIFVRKKKLGNFTTVSFGGTSVNISSREQTILDGLAFPRHCLGVEGIAKAIHFTRKELDWGKLLKLAKEDKSTVRRRLGFLLELLGLKRQAKGLKEDFRGFAWLDPASQKRNFTYNKKWGLKINVERKVLLEFMEGY